MKNNKKICSATESTDTIRNNIGKGVANMEKNDLLQYTDALFNIALSKTHNVDEAQELVQETCLHTLLAIEKGTVIDNLKTYAVSILYNRFNLSLRKKYKSVTVSYDMFSVDIPDSDDAFEQIFMYDETISIRRELGMLSYIYREVMVRYYMQNQSVNDIAAALAIPKGTVLSRLDVGRTKIKKGVESEMKEYTTNSYAPQTLWVSNSGNQGLNGEPYSVVGTDKLTQNLLILAYETPKTEEEIAREMGIPTAYIEPVVEKLIYNELMVRQPNGKVYTDFMILNYYDVPDELPAQIDFAHDHFDKFLTPINEAFDALRKTEFYVRQNHRQQMKLEHFFFMDLAEAIVWQAECNFSSNTPYHFPNRPNGGNWIAMGTIAKPENNNEYGHKYGYSGRRDDYIANYVNSKSIQIFEYSNYLAPEYHRDVPYRRMESKDLVCLLYLINAGINPSETGIDLKLLENLEVLTEKGYFTNENGKLETDVAIINPRDFREMTEIKHATAAKIAEAIREPFNAHIKTVKKEIPKHLKSVPEQKLYMGGVFSIPMAMINEFIDRKLFWQDIDFACPPCVLVVEK